LRPWVGSEADGEPVYKNIRTESARLGALLGWLCRVPWLTSTASPRRAERDAAVDTWGAQEGKTCLVWGPEEGILKVGRGVGEWKEGRSKD
jgi:hypothetical protein